METLVFLELSDSTKPLAKSARSQLLSQDYLLVSTVSIFINLVTSPKVAKLPVPTTILSTSLMVAQADKNATLVISET